MQATQSPPPQYTLPVVQPHLVTPASNVNHGYKSNSVRRLSTTQIILGCLAFGFQLWDIINASAMSVVGAGIWSGVFFILTGSIGTYSANRKTTCSIVSYMALSIFSSLLAVGLLVTSSINLSYYDNCYYYDWDCRHLSDYMRYMSIFLSTMLLLISLAEGFIGIISASLACHGCCCSTTNQLAPSYTNTLQYVQGPNGQLLLVTGQQPNIVTSNIVTTTTGQQILVPAYPGGYQAPGNHAQQYMTTVTTIPTQQPVQQPDTVQPPAYQAQEATGAQQPQADQAGEKDNTNMAYLEI